MSELVKFKVGTKSEYNRIKDKEPGTLYFCTDTVQMFRGTKEYSRSVIVAVRSQEDYIAGEYPSFLCYCSSTSKLYISIDSKWVEIIGSGSGGGGGGSVDITYITDGDIDKLFLGSDSV